MPMSEHLKLITELMDVLREWSHKTHGTLCPPLRTPLSKDTTAVNAEYDKARDLAFRCITAGQHLTANEVFRDSSTVIREAYHKGTPHEVIWQWRNLLGQPPEPRPLTEVAQFQSGALYARRTQVGGLEYVSDDVGGGQRIVDMSTVDLEMLRYIADNHERLSRTLPE